MPVVFSGRIMICTCVLSTVHVIQILYSPSCQVIVTCYTLCGWILRRCGVFYYFKCACCDKDVVYKVLGGGGGGGVFAFL